MFCSLQYISPIHQERIRTVCDLLHTAQPGQNLCLKAAQCAQQLGKHAEHLYYVQLLAAEHLQHVQFLADVQQLSDITISLMQYMSFFLKCLRMQLNISSLPLLAVASSQYCLNSHGCLDYNRNISFCKMQGQSTTWEQTKPVEGQMLVLNLLCLQEPL